MKKYPKNINLCIGEMFSRLPIELSFKLVSGSTPLYGRTIIDSDRLSVDQLLLTLGEIFEFDAELNLPSAKSSVLITGDIDTYITHEDNYYASLFDVDNDEVNI